MPTEKLKKIKLLLLDVDGVLTDGSIIYNDNGTETKAFNAKDGLGIRLLMDAGISVGIVTGRKSDALLHRCRNLGIDLVYDGIKDKAAMLKGIIETTGISSAEIAFMGDDLPDIPLMKLVGLPASVADAAEEVRGNALFVTENSGGKGAVREMAETILKAAGQWEKAIERFL